MTDAHLLGDLAHDLVGRCDRRVRRDPEHPARLVVVRRELDLPVGDAGPLRILEEGARRLVEGVRVVERAAAHACAGHDQDVGQQVDALDAEALHLRRPEVAAQVPGGARQLVVGEAASGLEHRDAVALLRQPQGGRAPAEAAADHENVGVLRQR